MKQKLVVFAVVLAVLSFVAPCEAATKTKVKKQVFAGVGYSIPRGVGVEAQTKMAGVAVLVPIAPKFFVRPFAVGGISDPVVSAKPTSRFLQTGMMIGLKATPRFTVLAGGAETFIFPQRKPTLRLPTAIVSTGTKLTAHWGVFTPLTIHEKSVAGALQLGYTW